MGLFLSLQEGNFVTWDYFYLYMRVTYAVYVVTWDYFYFYRSVTYVVYIVI